ncbi:uncharacterized protein [Nicotiana sylvestris]|uniref:uncharacterized protein n=1 Tax=Nicotiana sylvestris TaxID=4096 RepID=UPI00388C583A
MAVRCNETMQETNIDSEEYDIQEEIVKKVENFENKPKSNLDETEIVNLGDAENVKETRINVHLSPLEKEGYTEFVREYEGIFAWSYDDMTGLSTSIVTHKLPTDPTCPPVKQKLRKFKPDISLKIKEKVTKHVKAKVLRVVEYPTWLANIVPVPKKDGKMDEEDAEKTTFITSWGMYCYKIMPFGFKNTGSTYMRAMTTIFYDMIHKEIEVYGDDVIIKSKKATDHMEDLRKFFNGLRRHNLKLNPAKCAFGVPTEKLLGFIVSHRGIELDLSNVKAIQELPPPKNKKDELRKRFTKTEFQHVPRAQNEFVDALATLSSMIQHPDKNFIDPIPTASSMSEIATASRYTQT